MNKQDKVYKAACYYLDKKGHQRCAEVADKFFVDRARLHTMIAKVRLLRATSNEVINDNQ